MKSLERASFIGCLLLVAISLCSAEGDAETKDEFVPSDFIAPNIDSNSIYLFDYFKSPADLGKTWIKSGAKKDGDDSDVAKYNGEWEIQEPSTVVINKDYGLTVKSKARHHAIATRLNKPFVFDKAPLVVQYEVQFEDGQECGGGYLKLLSQGVEKDLSSFQDKTPYTVMFGPDKCGPSGKVHLIFRYKNPRNGSIDEYHAKQPSNLGTTYWDDHKTHLYTLVVHSDGKFIVSIDHSSIMSGNMLQDLVPALEPPKEIADPTDSKPADWDDRPEIDDESAVKPDDWDESQPKEIVDESAVKPSDWLEDEPELIPDPEAVKPDDWDVEMDGEWEPPSIDNPACRGVSGCGPWKKPTIANPLYKGKWIRPKIANPAFRGVWSPRLIANPAYFEPTAFEGLAPIGAVGIELWTMSQNINFDNILVTDSEELAKTISKETFSIRVAEYKRYEASQRTGGIIQAVVDAANENPWLWVVYVLCLLIPIILLGVCCFGRKSNSNEQTSAGRRVETFAEDDDKVPDLVDNVDDEEQGESAEQVVEQRVTRSRTPSASPARSKAAPTTPQAMKDIEDDDPGSNSETGDGDEAEASKETEEVHVSQPKTTVATKRKTRRE